MHPVPIAMVTENVYIISIKQINRNGNINAGYGKATVTATSTKEDKVPKRLVRNPTTNKEQRIVVPMTPQKKRGSHRKRKPEQTEP